MRKKALIIIISLVTYILIPLLIVFNIIDFKYRFYVLVIMGILSFGVAKLFKINNIELGITKKNALISIKRILPVTSSILLLSLVYYFLGFSTYSNNESVLFYLFYILISCPIQELLYRSILNKYLDEFKMNYILKIVIASLLFSLLHIIYMDTLTLVFTFIIGLYWNYCYYKDKNILGVTISHILIGVATIFLGII